MYPAINNHAIFLPERFSVEFDMYLFSPESGSRKNDNEDFCNVSFCGHTFYINTWARDIYNMYFIGGGNLKNFQVTKPGWHHFLFRFIGPDDNKVVLMIDGELIGKKLNTPYPRTSGDNNISFHSGTAQKFFCIKNVKITDESN